MKTLKFREWTLIFFACGVFGNEGLSNPDILISVDPPESFLSNHSDSYVIAEGADVNLTCELIFWGNDSYLNWTHPIVDIEDQHNQTLHYDYLRGSDVVTRNLSIKRATFLDSGNYSCYFWKHSEKQGDNPPRTIFLSIVPKSPVIHITVEPPEWLLHNDSRGNYTVKEGANVTLNCEFTYTGRTWFLDWTHHNADNESLIDKCQEEYPYISMEHKHDNDTELVMRNLFIENVQDDLTGVYHGNTYQCQPYQCHPQRPLEAIYSPKPKTLNILIDIFPLLTTVKDELDFPVILSIPGNHFVVDYSFTLDCLISNHDHGISLDWDFPRIDETDAYVIVNTNITRGGQDYLLSSLTIKSATLNDNSEFNCTVSASGRVAKSDTYAVHVEETLEPFINITQKELVKAIEGIDVSLIHDVIAFPPNPKVLYRYYDGRQVNDSEKRVNHIHPCQL